MSVSSNSSNKEILLSEEEKRYVIFPVQQSCPIWQMYKKAVSSFWTPEEIDLSKDMDDYTKLKDEEQHFIKNVLAFSLLRMELSMKI